MDFDSLNEDSYISSRKLKAVIDKKDTTIRFQINSARARK